MSNKREFDEITVALVCYEEEEQLALLLEDLKKQSFLKHIKEILLLQNANHKNGICQKTKKIAKSFQKQLPLVLLSSKENHLGLARSKLIEKAQSKWVAFTDSDCRLEEDWLEKLVENVQKQDRNRPLKDRIKQQIPKPLKELIQKSPLKKAQPADKNLKPLKPKRVLAVGGPNRLPENKFWKKMVNLSLEFPIGHGFSPQAWIPPRACSVSHIPTTNGLFLKSSILTAGNFSSRFPRAGEDLDMGERLKKQGELLLFPKPLVINNYAFSYLESLKRLFAFGLAQNKSKGLLFYLSLLFLPLFVFSCASSLVWLLSSTVGPGMNLTESSHIHSGFFSSMSRRSALFFLSCYLILLFGYSLKACFKTKKLSPLSLVFFWLLQHIAYSSGACFAFLFKKEI